MAAGDTILTSTPRYARARAREGLLAVGDALGVAHHLLDVVVVVELGDLDLTLVLVLEVNLTIQVVLAVNLTIEVVGNLIIIAITTSIAHVVFLFFFVLVTSRETN